MNAPTPSGSHVMTSTRVNEQGTVVQNEAGISDEVQIAQQQMAEQRVEMKQLGTIADDMIDRVGELTKAFHAIDANMAEGTVKVQCDVNSTPAHVQGTSLNVNEPVGHVSSVPVNVIDLVSHSSGEQR